MRELLDLPMQVLAKLERGRTCGGHHDLTYQLDLGADHWLSFVRWGPDFSIESNRARWGQYEEIIKAHPLCGANVIHRCTTETGFHMGGINFRTPATALWDAQQAAHCWDVHSWQPLTLSPSLLSHCPCKDHGYIREGRWVRA